MRLYLGVLSIFLLFAFTFIVYQQRREKDYKVSVLDARLQDFNVQMSEAITSSPKDIKPFIDRYIVDNDMRGLRVTLIRPDGTVTGISFTELHEKCGAHTQHEDEGGIFLHHTVINSFPICFHKPFPPYFRLAAK